MIQRLTEFVQKGEIEELKAALEKDPSIAEGLTDHGISLLQFAAYCRSEEAVRIIREHKKELDIFEAASLGEESQVTKLLKSDKLLLNSFSSDGFTVLGLASFFGHFSLAKILLEKGADPNIPANNSFKVTPLHSGCAISNYKIADLLIQHGANVNAKQMSGVTPLHSTAHNGQLKITELLIQNGADVNAKTEDGKTPLAMAKEEGTDAVISLIRDSGGM